MFTLKNLIKRTTGFDYFVGALRAYALKGDEAAGVAAFLTVCESSEPQRRELAEYLWRLSADSDEPEHGQGRSVVAARLDSLRVRVIARKWGRLDVASAATLLKELDRAYYEGHGRTDPMVFYRRYPELRNDPFPPSE